MQTDLIMKSESHAPRCSHANEWQAFTYTIVSVESAHDSSFG